jgi:arylsulfatase A
LPTVAHLIGAKPPARKIDGLDITDVITGKTDTSPHDALAFYFNANDLQGLRSGRWKLELPRTYDTLAGKPGGTLGRQTSYTKAKVTKAELYDLDTDPGETRDVAAQNPEVMAKMLEHAERFRADLGDDATGRKGTGRREPGRAGEGSVYPSDPGFAKAPDLPANGR